MSTDKEIGEGNPELDPNDSDTAKELYSDFIVGFAKEISTDGGKTARIQGATILLDQPTAQPKQKP